VASNPHSFGSLHRRRRLALGVSTIVTMNTMAVLEKALRAGNTMHAFRSGGGLRVIRIEKGQRGALKGYGEHPGVDEALQHAAEDYEAGHRDYSKVYSSKGLYPHYLTGSSSSETELDAWIRQGLTRLTAALKRTVSSLWTSRVCKTTSGLKA
jgi:hypothetical protein